MNNIPYEFIDACVGISEILVSYDEKEDKNKEILSFYISVGNAIYNSDLYYDFEKDFEENFDMFLKIMKKDKFVASKNNVFGAVCYSIVWEEVKNKELSLYEEIIYTYNRFNELLDKYYNMVGVNKEKASDYFALYLSLATIIDSYHNPIGGGL